MQLQYKIQVTALLVNGQSEIFKFCLTAQNMTFFLEGVHCILRQKLIKESDHQYDLGIKDHCHMYFETFLQLVMRTFFYQGYSSLPQWLHILCDLNSKDQDCPCYIGIKVEGQIYCKSALPLVPKIPL